MPKAKSKKQAGFFGVIASGKKKVKGFSPVEAKERLKGVNYKKLPKTKKK